MPSLPTRVADAARGTESDAARGTESNIRLLCDLLDTLIAIRIDVGHGANGMAASPALDAKQLQGIRLMLGRAIASTKDLLGSAECLPPIE